MLRFDIPWEFYWAFCAQANAARSRRIAWEFTLPDWWAWWTKDNRWVRRGRKSHQLCMARCRDTGPYAPGNVFPATPQGNYWSRPFSSVELAWERSRLTRERNGTVLGANLRMRGEGHPSSKLVTTPAGRFGSATLAGEHHGISSVEASTWARNRLNGWRYER